MWKLAALLALATVIVARPGCAPDQFQSTVLGQIAFKGNRSNINHDGVILVSVDFTYDFDQQQEASFIRLYQNETGYEYFKEYRNYQSVSKLIQCSSHASERNVGVQSLSRQDEVYHANKSCLCANSLCITGLCTPSRA